TKETRSFLSWCVLTNKMNKLLPFIVLVNVVSGFGAHFSSARVGTWNDSSTWGGAGVPQNGDTVRISHEVSILSSVIVGHSPSVSRDAVPAITMRGGSLIVGSTGSLTVRGDIRLESLSSTARATLLMQ